MRVCVCARARARAYMRVCGVRIGPVTSEYEVLNLSDSLAGPSTHHYEVLNLNEHLKSCGERGGECVLQASSKLVSVSMHRHTAAVSLQDTARV